MRPLSLANLQHHSHWHCLNTHWETPDRSLEKERRREKVLPGCLGYCRIVFKAGQGLTRAYDTPDTISAALAHESSH